MADTKRLPNQRSIVVNGTPTKVSGRDYALWMMVKTGVLTEDELAEYQAVIPDTASIKDARSQAEDIRYGRTKGESRTERVVRELEKEESTPDGDGSLEPWKSLTPTERLFIYSSLGQGMLQDLSAVSLEQIQAYSYGAHEDAEAMKVLREMDDSDEKTALEYLMSPNLLHDEIQELQYGIQDQMSWDLDASGKPILRDGKVSSEAAMRLNAILEQRGAVNEPVFDMALMTLASAAVGGVAGAGLVPGVAARTAPMTTTTSGALWPKGMPLAGKILKGGLVGAGRITGGVWKNKFVRYGGAVVGVSSTGLIGSAIYEATKEDQEEIEQATNVSFQVVPPNTFPVAVQTDSLSPRGQYGFQFNPDDPLGRLGQFGPGVTPVPAFSAQQTAAQANVPETGVPGIVGASATGRTAGTSSAWDPEGPGPSATSPAADAAARRERRIQGEEDMSALYESDPYLGVGRNYETERATEDIVGEWRSQGLSDQQIRMSGIDLFQDIQTVTPNYRSSDIDKIIGRLTPGGLEEVQQQMVDARLIDPDAFSSGQPFYPGVAGYQTVEALEYALMLANRSGGNWSSTLEQMADLGRQRTAEEEAEAAAAEREAARVTIPPYVPETYIEPDMASLRVMATDAVETELGRKINNWELELLADQMKADHQANFDQHEAAARAEYTAGKEMYSGGQLYEPSYAEAGAPVEAVDFEARMVERFDEMFGKEVDRKKRTEYVADQTQRLFQGFDNAASAIRR